MWNEQQHQTNARHEVRVLHMAMSQAEADQTVRVFVYYPSSLLSAVRRDGEDALVGWTVHGDPFGKTVILVVAGSTNRHRASQCGLSVQTAIAESEQQPCLLGSFFSSPPSEDFVRPKECVWLQLRQSADRCITLTSLQLPRIGERHRVVTLVTYKIPRPEKMRYLTLEPMILPFASLTDTDEQEAREADVSSKRLHALTLLDPVRFADLTHAYASGRAPGQGFRCAVQLINKAANLNVRIARQTQKSAKSNGEHNPSSFVSSLFVNSLATLRSGLLHKVKGTSLVHTSASLRQLSLRLGQVLVWPSLGRQIRTARVNDQEPVSVLAPRYTALYNGVWLVANDVIIGQAVGSLLCDYSHGISVVLQRCMQIVLVTFVIDAMHWLDSWPLGIKLNTPLSRFFCDMFAGMTDVLSHYALAQFLFRASDGHLLERLVYGVGILTRTFGVSMLLCLAIDSIRLFTAHLTMFYRVQQATYAFFCSSIASLFHLFRGKKRNPLRNMRVDQATYALDQLLLGTLFFTLLSFLWLTVATYYAFFALIRLSILAAIAVLEAALAIINHLPLFALTLRCKDSARLPGGLALLIDWKRTISSANIKNHDGQEHVSNTCTYAELVNTPLSFADIFRGHGQHLQRICKLPRLAFNVVLGKRI